MSASSSYNADLLEKQKSSLHQHQRFTPTATFGDNYGYTINFYQPMIDYLDAKRRGEHPSYPHLPLNNERCLPAYSSRKPIETYSRTDLRALSTEILDKARQREVDFDAYKIRSKRSTVDTTLGQVRGTRAAQRLHLPSVEERIIRRQEERVTQRRCNQIMDRASSSNARLIRSRKGDDDVQLSDTLKSAIRGKTATQITAALLADSENNIRMSRQREVEMTSSSSCSSSSKNISSCTTSVSGGRRIVKRTVNVELSDDGVLDGLDGTLLDVKKQLSCFNRRNEDLQQTTRLRRVYFA